jgi:hypothetical protein
MEACNDILKELREVAPELAKLHKVNFYTAPDNYFLNFSSGILEKAKQSEVKVELANLAPVLSKLKEQTPATPSNYFSSFSSSLLEKIRRQEVASELNDIAPTLKSLQKVNMYQAPANYFAKFPVQMQKQIATANVRPESAVPGWLSRLNILLDETVSVIFKPQYTFAFAGSVAMIMIVIMMFFKAEPVTPCAPNDLLCQLNKVSNEDLNAYFSAHPDEFHKSVLDVSTDDSRLQRKSEKGALSLDNYVSSSISDEELNNAILD